MRIKNNFEKDGRILHTTSFATTRQIYDLAPKENDTLFIDTYKKQSLSKINVKTVKIAT